MIVLVPNNFMLEQGGLIVPFRYPPSFQVSFSDPWKYKYKSIFRPQDYKTTPNTSIIFI